MNKCLYCGKPVKNKYCDTSCQNKHSGYLKAIKRYGDYKEFEVVCNKCGNIFKVTEREKLFPKKDKYFCSRSCANSKKVNDDTKKKISKSIKKYYLKQQKYKLNLYFLKRCENCNSFYLTKRINQRFCSVSCSTTWKNKNIDMARLAGLKSSQIQKEIRRSKNEIYFYDLCVKNFNNVTSNEQIFDGWDADIIIYDYNIAILWNGVWHYKKITKQHSVKQVQNRDNIKIKKIKNKGFIPYIIKDMGKYSKEFVDEQFIILKKYIVKNFDIKK